MNIYYAIGGGLGHLTRAVAFLHQLNLEKQTAILTSSDFANDKRIVGDIEILHVNPDLSHAPEKLRTFLNETFKITNCEKLFLDAFPFGIVGEFIDFDFGSIEVSYIARLLNWKNYFDLNTKVSKSFSRTYKVEDLGIKHLKFIERSSDSFEKHKITYPDTKESDLPSIDEVVADNSPFWLIAHSGNHIETNELLAYANEMREAEKVNVRLLVTSPYDFECEFKFDINPASILFPFAERIFTACGFNTMKQTEKFREKHFFMPFERRFDDQFERARRAREILKVPILSDVETLG